jgi:hypothetical protein
MTAFTQGRTRIVIDSQDKPTQMRRQRPGMT